MFDNEIVGTVLKVGQLGRAMKCMDRKSMAEQAVVRIAVPCCSRFVRMMAFVWRLALGAAYTYTQGPSSCAPIHLSALAPAIIPPPSALRALTLSSHAMRCVQVALVAAFVGLSIFIANLGEPIIENTLNSFPKPQG